MDRAYTELPLNLVYVTPRYLPSSGGIETHVAETSRRISRLGATVTILTTEPSRNLPSIENSDGIEIRRVMPWPGARDTYFTPEIYHILRSGKWSLAHCQGYNTLVPPLAMLACLRAGIPYVLTFHGGGHSSWLRKRIRKPQLQLLRPLLARAEKLIAVANFEKEFYGKQLRLAADRFTYIPNGCDLPHLPQVLPSGGAPLIASIGRLERYKGHHRVIEAFPLVLQGCPGSRLRIVGTGPYESSLRQLVRRLRLENVVEIRGISPDQREAMARLLVSCSLVVLLSEFETHPIAVLEALAAGRPALLADNSGLKELASRGLARAIPLVSTREEVADAILAQLKNPLVPPKVILPTWDDCASGLLHLYREVLGRQKPAHKRSDITWRGRGPKIV
jgi:glycosyltransferase involved in cell wall biosynthesis